MDRGPSALKRFVVATLCLAAGAGLLLAAYRMPQNVLDWRSTARIVGFSRALGVAFIILGLLVSGAADLLPARRRRRQAANEESRVIGNQ